MRLCLTYGLILLVNTNFAQIMKLEVKNRTELTGIPSASGIEFYGDWFYIIGDNSAWLYRYRYPLRTFEKYAIYDTTNVVNDTIPKIDKPDFEASTIAVRNGQRTLLIFGSGSKSPRRDVLIRVDMNNPQKSERVSLEKFYLQLRSGGVSDLNIEGAVFANEYLYLLNRADNSIIRFSYAEFELFLQSPNHDLNFTHHKFTLPVIENVQVSFSGACMIPETNRMIITASLEQTDNWIDDGAILGSYIGLVELDKLTDTNTIEIVPIMEQKNVLKIKIESVTVKSVRKNKVHLFMVTDSDGGSSELVEANLFLH